MVHQLHLAALAVFEEGDPTSGSNSFEDPEAARALLIAFNDYRCRIRRLVPSGSNGVKPDFTRSNVDKDDTLAGVNGNFIGSLGPPGDHTESAAGEVSHTTRSQLPTTLQNGIERAATRWDDIDRAIEWLRRYIWRYQSSKQVLIPSWAITRFDITWGEHVGSGRFSDVFRGVWQKFPDRRVAIKRVYKMTFHEFALFEREASIWQTLRHPNVLELFGASYNSNGPVWFFVTPYYSKGNLATYLSRLPSLHGVDILKMMAEVADGMAYLHSRAILHGDLKAANVLVDGDLSCVISNFGQSERKYKVDRRRWISNATAYSPKWLTPEQMAGESVITQHIDVYAYAFTCVEILCKGDGPWPSVDAQSMRQFEKRRPDIPSLKHHWIIQLSEMLSRCWHQDQNMRPSFSEVNVLTKRMRFRVEPQAPGSPEVLPGRVNALKAAHFLIFGVICPILALAAPFIYRAFSPRTVHIVGGLPHV
ncbi:kinase-like domain-containing protein [Trametes meyenii]|nr:kinase-like domain-containing protein [Trametes meyenii]